MVITGIELSFGDWVRLLVKFSIVAIPAMIIISLICVLIGFGFAVVRGGPDGVRMAG